MRASYVERWAGHRLWVYADQDGGTTTSLVFRAARGGRFADKLLGRATSPPWRVPGLGCTVPHCLVLGLVDLYGAETLRSVVDQVLLAEQPAPPPGATGAVYLPYTQMELPLDPVDPPA